MTPAHTARHSTVLIQHYTMEASGLQIKDTAHGLIRDTRPHPVKYRYSLGDI